jgi:hypothetical protein
MEKIKLQISDPSDAKYIPCIGLASLRNLMWQSYLRGCSHTMDYVIDKKPFPNSETFSSMFDEFTERIEQYFERDITAQEMKKQTSEVL